MQRRDDSTDDTDRCFVEVEPHVAGIHQLLAKAFLRQAGYVIERSLHSLHYPRSAVPRKTYYTACFGFTASFSSVQTLGYSKPDMSPLPSSSSTILASFPVREVPGPGSRLGSRSTDDVRLERVSSSVSVGLVVSSSSSHEEGGAHGLGTVGLSITGNGRISSLRVSRLPSWECKFMSGSSMVLDSIFVLVLVLVLGLERGRRR